MESEDRKHVKINNEKRGTTFCLYFRGSFFLCPVATYTHSSCKHTKKNAVANVFIALLLLNVEKIHAGIKSTVRHRKLVLKTKSKQFNELNEFFVFPSNQSVFGESKRKLRRA